MKSCHLLLVSVCACVATNPDWDEPVASDPSDTTGAPDTDDTDTGSDAGTTDDAAASADESQQDSSGGTSSTTGGPVPPCEMGLGSCDGECFDVKNDPRHCGMSCVDCRSEFGEDAECNKGDCREGDGDGDD